MKYIKTTQENGTMEVFIFPHSVDHDNMATMISLQRGESSAVFRRPVSAGFYDDINGCYGNSETLGLTSEMNIDTELVKKQMDGVV